MGNFLKYIHPLLKRKKSDKNYEDVNYAIINALDTEISDLEKEAMASKIQSSLKTAKGEYLDLWGEWFYVKRRENEEDDLYRERIIKFLLLKRGTNNAIVDALRDFLNDYDSYINIYEPFTNIFYTNKSKLDGEDHLMGDYYRFAIIDITLGRKFPVEIIDIINEFKPAGVKFYLTYDHARDVEGDGIIEMPPANVEITARTHISTLGGYGGYIRGHVNLGNLTYKSIFDYENDEKGNSNIFRTDNSLINGLDVLGGEAGAGSKYANTAMLTSKTYYPTVLDTPHTFTEVSGVELLESEFNRGTKQIDDLVGSLKTLGGNVESNLYVGLDVYRYLSLNYPSTVKDYIDTSELKNKITKVAKDPKLVLKANALASPTEPITTNVYIFNFSNNQWDFLDTIDLDLNGVHLTKELGNIRDNLSDTGAVFLRGTVEATEEPIQINVDYLDLSFKDYVKDYYTIIPYEGKVEGYHNLVNLAMEVDLYKRYAGNNPEVMLDSYYKPTGFYRIKGLGSTRISHVLKDEDYSMGIESEDNSYHFLPTGILSKEYLKPFTLTEDKTNLDLVSNFEFAGYYTLSFMLDNMDEVNLKDYRLNFYQEKKSTNTQELVASYNLANSTLSSEGIISQTNQFLSNPYKGDTDREDFGFYVEAEYLGQEVQVPLEVKAFILKTSSIIKDVPPNVNSISYVGQSNLKDYSIEEIENGVHLKAPSDGIFDFSFNLHEAPVEDNQKPYYYNELVRKGLKPSLLIPYKVTAGSKGSGMVRAYIKDAKANTTIASFYINNNKDSSSLYDYLVIPLSKLVTSNSLYISTSSITGLNIIGGMKQAFYTEDNALTLQSAESYLPIVSKEYIIKGEMTVKFKANNLLNPQNMQLYYGSIEYDGLSNVPALLESTSKVASTVVNDTMNEYMLTVNVPTTRRGYNIQGVYSEIKDMSKLKVNSKDESTEVSNIYDDTYTITNYSNPIDVSIPIYNSDVFSDYPVSSNYNNHHLYLSLLSPVDATVKLSTSVSSEETYQLEANKLYRLHVPAPIVKGREAPISLHIKSSNVELTYGSFVYKEEGYDTARLIQEDESIKLQVPMQESTLNVRDLEITVPQSENSEDGGTDSYLTVTSTEGKDIPLHEYYADSLNKERKNYTLHGNYTNIAKVTYHSDGILKNVEIERSIDGKNWKSIQNIKPDLAEGSTKEINNELVGKYGIEIFSLDTINAMSKVLLRSIWDATIGSFEDGGNTDVSSISDDFFNTTFTNLRHLAELKENKIKVITDVRGGNMDNSSGSVISMSGSDPMSRTVIHMSSETATKYKLPFLAGSYIELSELGDKTYNDTEYEVNEEYKAYSFRKENS